MTREQIQEFTLRTTNSNHSGLILVLFDVVKVYIKDALTYFDNGEMEGYYKNISLAKKAHNELMSCINPKDQLGRKTLKIFRFIYEKLIMSELKRKPYDLDRCVLMLDNLQIGFEHLHQLDHEEPVMKNSHQVYAGLTYGKGVLNESIEGNHMSRGFKA